MTELEIKRKIEEEKISREAEIREVKDRIKLTNTNLENLRREKEQLEDDFLNYKFSINQKIVDAQQAFDDLEFENSRQSRILDVKIGNSDVELREVSDTLFYQKRKLTLVSEQIDSIQEEVYNQADKFSQMLKEILNTAKNTDQRVENMERKINKLEEQFRKSQEESEWTKEEAKRANERIDNLLKNQVFDSYKEQGKQNQDAQIEAPLKSPK